MIETTKVSGNSDPKKLAGFIANFAREGKEISITGIGAKSVSQAVKSIAIANSYLAANAIMLSMTPRFTVIERENSEDVTGIEILLSDRSFTNSNGNNTEVKVSSHTKTGPLASAVIRMAKDDRMPVMQAIGAGAINQAIKGIAVANKYLSTELKMIPGFAIYSVSGEEKTGMELRVNY